MPRTAEVIYVGDPASLLRANEAVLASSSKTAEGISRSYGQIMAAGDAAGKAASTHAAAMGASLSEQNAAYGRAAQAAGAANDKIAASARRAGEAAARQAAATGASLDGQRAAYARAATAAEAQASATATAAQKAAAAHEAAAVKTAAAHDKMMSAAQKSNAAFAKWGSLVGVAVIGASVDMAIKLEDAGVAIAKAGNTSTTAGKKIEDAFKTFPGTVEYSAAKIGMAFSTIAGELKVTEGHALNASQSMKVMDAALALTDATGGDLTATTEDLGKVMLTFSLRSGEAAKASDVLFNASKATGTSVDTFTTTVDKARGRLGALAPSLVDTSALMAELAKQGVSGRLTMGALGGVFGTLLSQNKKVTETLKELNVHVFDSNGKFVGLKSVIEQLHPALGKYTEASQLMATRTLFGEKANKQMLEVIHKGVPEFEAATRTVDKHGTAAAAAAKEHTTLAGKLKATRADIEKLSGSIGERLIPILGKVVGAVTDTIKWFDKHRTAAKALAITIGTVLGAAMLDFAVVKTAKFVGATKAMVDGVSTLAAKVAKRSGEVEASFAGQATAAETAAGKTAAAEAGLAKEVEAADSKIATANKAAGKSFTAMLGPIALVVAALVEAQPLIEKLTGGGLTESPQHKSEIESTLQASGQKLNSDMGGGIMGYFMSKGLTAAQAAGIVGNFQQESSLNPEMNTKEGRGLDSGTGSRAHGGTAKQQIEAIWKELETTEKATLVALKAAKSPQEAARIFSERFERPSNPMLSNREKYAAEAYAKHPQAHHTHAQKAAEAPEYGSESLPESSKAAKHHKAAKAKGEAYVAPLSHAQITREDMGLDFAAHPGEAVKAIGSGVIDSIIKNWYKGQSLIEEKLTSGAHKGQYVYYAEQLNSKVRQGQHVRAGQAVATVAAGGTGLELGFGAGEGRTLAQARKEFHDHPGNDPTQASKAFASFLKSIGKGGSDLQLASKAFEKVAKAELAKQTADVKQGQSQLSKIVGAVHSGGVKELSAVVGGKHDTWLERLVAKLHGDHTSALDSLAGKLVRAHKSALHAMTEAVQTAAKKAAEKAAETAAAAAKEASEQSDREAEAGAANDRQKAEERAAAPGIHLSAYQGDLGKIDLEERAGLLTPAQAKAAKEALANRAIGGGYGELSTEGLLQAKGDLREFQKATQEATSALEAHTNALKESAKALTEFTNAGNNLSRVEVGSLAKSIADIANGQIAGVNYHGRAMTPGAGRAASY